MGDYDFAALERKWRPVWKSLDLAREGERRTVVDMFAYPSGDLHMGHAEAYALGDAIARFWTQQGFDVLHPIGWDSFGLPAENAAIKRGIHPADWTYANIETQAETFRRYATSVDWGTRLHTSDPSFYRWTQWLFLRLYEGGLAERRRAPVNWCPADQTVLANEQVIGGRCERCGAEVVDRELTQWFLRITAYANQLLDDMAELEGKWPPAVLTMQRNWIGHMRDWLVSRQRFWGCPIPVVHCGECGVVPVPDDQLPVELPDLRGADLTPRGVSPLAAARDWVEVACPRCGGPAERDTDTLDTFVDSSWYFLRYCSPSYAQGPFNPDEVRRWMPVDQYVGGPGHAVLHLLYARFFTKALRDLGLIDFGEPFRRLLTQGQVVLNGSAMSKSRGNMVHLGEQLDTYGVDAVRLSMVFAGPPEDDIDWADVSPGGAARFLSRVLRLAGNVTSSPGVAFESGEEELRRTTHRLLKQITALIEERRFNVAVARAMQLATAARHAPPADPATREATEVLAVVLSLFTPYVAEEMWSRLGHPPTVARAGWPAIDPILSADRTVTCVVQVNGKVRDRLQVPPDITPAALETLARATTDREVTRAIVRPPKLVNLVTR
ncbi:class I tRNA ligase family protein [Actinoplanes sp. Pm04-4]|uniref:leucine--tRNA ligase n=1 Tax=Paractinoplanes pyxinae TaxID=2997416 RepID=A0ABT4B8F3_9ACTN|nr:class I tRNA ligase family protein [Actinoplanes pyxinae]MCY1142791.1 class I tRNA ligase family protein [Actinoplanes pyxinae]